MTVIITKVTIPEYDKLILHHCDTKYSLKPTSLRRILFDNYDYLSHLHQSGKLTDDTFHSLQMSILCSTYHLGYVTYECPNCHNYRVISRTCKSRFCNTCGAKYAATRAAYLSSISLDVPHRHIVFTIPKQLRLYFAKYRELLHLLFIASRNVIASWVNKSYLDKQKRMYKTLASIPPKLSSPYLFKDISLPNRFGAISTLHTFGRDLKFSPHIHMLVPELYYHSKKDKLCPLTHFNYHFLRKTWQFQLLSILKPFLPSHLLSSLYRDYKEGFYVYAFDPKREPDYHFDEDSSTTNSLTYMLRYASRPAMAESRITNYDSSTKTIDWFYHPHEDEDTLVKVHESVYDFLHKLLLHHPRKHFKMIRYYGFYANACQLLLNHIHHLHSDNTSHKLTVKQRQRIEAVEKQKLYYRTFMISTFHKDPILCPCGTLMKYLDTFDPLDQEGRRLKNDRRYRSQCINEMQKMQIPRVCTSLGS